MIESMPFNDVLSRVEGAVGGGLRGSGRRVQRPESDFEPVLL